MHDAFPPAYRHAGRTLQWIGRVWCRAKLGASEVNPNLVISLKYKFKVRWQIPLWISPGDGSPHGRPASAHKPQKRTNDVPQLFIWAAYLCGCICCILKALRSTGEAKHCSCDNWVHSLFFTIAVDNARMIRKLKVCGIAGLLCLYLSWYMPYNAIVIKLAWQNPAHLQP